MKYFYILTIMYPELAQKHRRRGKTCHHTFTGTISATLGETRSQLYGKIADKAAGQAGIGRDLLSVSFFLMEPDKI